MRLSIFLKSILFSILFLIADYQSVAQSPESMNYQAVIRDGSGNVLSSQAVSLRIKILQGSASGSSVYEETFTPTTNAYGSIAIQIGNGTVVSGTFNTIDWGGNTHFVETAVDISGGSNYTVISTTQLMSVPYALYAKNAGSSPADNDWTESGSNIYRSSGNVGIENNSPQSVLHLGSNSNLAYNYGTTLTISGSGNTPSSGGTSRIFFENTSNTSNKIAAFSYGGNLFNIGALTNSGSSWNGWMMSLNVDNKIVTVENTLKVEDSLEVTGKSIFSNLSGSGDRMVVANSSGTLSTQAIPSAGVSIPNGSNNGDMMYWDGSAWQTIAVGSAGAVLQIINGVPTWVSTPDITGPTITLNGNANMNVVVGGTFTDPGATTDEGTLTTSGSVDATTVGTYTITYTSTDATGNTATATRTVAVYQSQYNYTGSAQTFTVPAGVTSISVDAYGASGSTNFYAGSEGKGGRVQTNLTVTPGQVLNIYVGGARNYAGYSSSVYAGGWNGGGSGPNPNCSGVGSAGGGATDIRIGSTALTDRVLVAGGGGGCANGGDDGGDGGGLVGQNGAGGSVSSGPRYGTGGSQSAGGAGGYSWYGDGTPTYSIIPTSNASLGDGGDGWACNSGGGGGGYYGGGGGADAGGGGGSSYTHPTLCNSVVHTQGVQTGSGQLIITIP